MFGNAGNKVKALCHEVCYFVSLFTLWNSNYLPALPTNQHWETPPSFLKQLFAPGFLEWVVSPSIEQGLPGTNSMSAQNMS